jgi:hypothetical protein
LKARAAVVAPVRWSKSSLESLKFEGQSCCGSTGTLVKVTPESPGEATDVNKEQSEGVDDCVV